jgi:hypothetical protein
MSGRSRRRWRDVPRDADRGAAARARIYEHADAIEAAARELMLADPAAIAASARIVDQLNAIRHLLGRLPRWAIPAAGQDAAPIAVRFISCRNDAGARLAARLLGRLGRGRFAVVDADAARPDVAVIVCPPACPT